MSQAITVFESYDVALVQAVTDLEPGERLVVHSLECFPLVDRCICPPDLWLEPGEA